MEIQGPGGASGPKRIEPQTPPAAGKPSPAARAGGGDRVEISEHARLLEKLSRVPAVRQEKVRALREMIESGNFETPERIRGAVERLLQELA